MNVFTLSIELDNDAMQTASEVAEALRALADRLERGDLTEETTPHGGNIMDANGNTVGSWQTSKSL